MFLGFERSKFDETLRYFLFWTFIRRWSDKLALMVSTARGGKIDDLASSSMIALLIWKFSLAL
ncbi:MAG: hypothetical protein CTY31_04175 [Hyphomicrobium sp.]|nr:MAG: hypothetical protein CTY39_01935 [Hyphomicrobium sp.]PPD00352.1 MAG: hypothetical protein CTY31_04175 [Hyphomicrobium sp.]